jgi:hypothetical protein
MVNDAKELQTKIKHWGFQCDCAICQDFQATGATIHHKRKTMRQGLKPLFDSVMTKQVLGKIEAQLESLSQTYRRPADEVPRLAMWDPQLALARIYAANGKIDKSLEWLAKALISLGFVTTGLNRTAKALTVIKWGLSCDYVVQAFLQARIAFIVLKLHRKMEQAELFARTAYRIVVGEDSTFDRDHYGLEMPP